jgi:hypothetical protein
VPRLEPYPDDLLTGIADITDARGTTEPGPGDEGNAGSESAA